MCPQVYLGINSSDSLFHPLPTYAAGLVHTFPPSLCTTQDDNLGINSSANFSNFLYALSALLRLATGDNWTDLMYGCMLQVGRRTHGTVLLPRHVQQRVAEVELRSDLRPPPQARCGIPLAPGTTLLVFLFLANTRGPCPPAT